MCQLKIRYGVDEMVKTYASAPTVGQIRQDAGLRAALGYGDNVHLLINGVAQSDSIVVPSGTTVTVETAANKKAA